MFLGAKRWTATSVRFAIALTRLNRDGILRERLGPATGAWKYNGQIAYWALEPVAVGAATISWSEHCHDLGRSAEWTEGDRVEVQQLVSQAQ